MGDVAADYRKQFAEMTDDELGECSRKLDEYKPEAREALLHEFSRRGFVLEPEEQEPVIAEEEPDPEPDVEAVLGVRWMKIWMYGLLPLHGVLASAVLGLKLAWGAGNDDLLFLAVYLITLVSLIYMLAKRKMMGWRLNWFFLFVPPPYATWSLDVEPFSGNPETVMTEIVSYVVSGAVILTVLLIWYRVNYLYWKKRRVLFAPDVFPPEYVKMQAESDERGTPIFQESEK
jgi:hypothetical protein